MENKKYKWNSTTYSWIKEESTSCIGNYIKKPLSFTLLMDQMRFLQGRGDNVFSDFWISNIWGHLGTSQTYISRIKIFSSSKNPLTIQQRWLQNKTNGIILPQRCHIKSIHVYIQKQLRKIKSLYNWKKIWYRGTNEVSRDYFCYCFSWIKVWIRWG